MKDIQIGPVENKEKTTGQRTLSSIIWLISTARNIIVVVFCAVLGYLYKENGNLPFKLSSILLLQYIILYNSWKRFVVMFSTFRSRRIRSARLQVTAVREQGRQRDIQFRRHGVQVGFRDFGGAASIHIRKHIIS